MPQADANSKMGLARARNEGGQARGRGLPAHAAPWQAFSAAHRGPYKRALAVCVEGSAKSVLRLRAEERADKTPSKEYVCPPVATRGVETAGSVRGVPRNAV